MSARELSSSSYACRASDLTNGVICPDSVYIFLHLCVYDVHICMCAHVCICVCACADVYSCAFVCVHAGAHLPCAHWKSEDGLRCQPFPYIWFEAEFLSLEVETAGLAVP